MRSFILPPASLFNLVSAQPRLPQAEGVGDGYCSSGNNNALCGKLVDVGGCYSATHHPDTKCGSKSYSRLDIYACKPTRGSDKPVPVETSHAELTLNGWCHVGVGSGSTVTTYLLRLEVLDG